MSETRDLRFLVFDRGSVDIDLHILDDTGTESGCLHRTHELIDVTLQPGTYYLALDTFVGTTPKPGEYLLAILDQ